MGPVEQQLGRRMLMAYETAKRELGYNATRFLQMLSEQGGLATAQSLLRTPTPSNGFTRMWMEGRPELTVEYIALDPRFAELFTAEELATARERLGDRAPGPPA